MKVSTFHDGERFIVVFEGINPSEEDLIKGLLSPMSVDNVVRQPMVEPIESGEEETPEIPVVFTDGQYEGLTPFDILGQTPKEARAAYRYICENIKNFDEKLANDCNAGIRQYLKSSFENVDGEEYSNKLSDNAVKMFFDLYKQSIPSEMMDGKRETIPEIINYFKK